MKIHFKSIFSNPIAFSLLLLIIAIVLFIIGDSENLHKTVRAITDSLGGSLVVAAVFAVIYEYFSRENLIASAVYNAVGQSKACELGVIDLTDDVGTIDHKLIMRNSVILRISSRYSAVLLSGNRSEIYNRLKIDKAEISYLKMADAKEVPQGSGNEGTPEKFFKTLSPNDNDLLTRVKLFEVDRLFSYNFVESDSGIWIKLYLNAGTPEAPPAFFVRKNSRLYNLYKKDIDALFDKASLLELVNE